MVLLAAGVMVVCVVLAFAWARGRAASRQIIERIQETDALLGRRTDDIDAWHSLYKRWSKVWSDFRHLL